MNRGIYRPAIVGFNYLVSGQAALLGKSASWGKQYDDGKRHNKNYRALVIIQWNTISFSTIPSLMKMALSVASASSGLWVTITIVRLNLLDSILSRSNTSLPVLMSRLPVGSSARIIDGPFMSALAIATLCCWAPAQGSRLEVCLVADVEYFKERSGTPLPVCAAHA